MLQRASVVFLHICIMSLNGSEFKYWNISKMQFQGWVFKWLVTATSPRQLQQRHGGVFIMYGALALYV